MKRLALLITFFAVALVGSRWNSSAAIFMVTSSADDGLGSLRQAIQNANTTTGPDQIHFQIETGPLTIVLQSPLPFITEPVVLDATTQPGFSGSPLIELSGENLTSPTTGHALIIAGGDTTIRGLVINRFPGGGIVIAGKGGNLVEGNYIGTDRTGSQDLGNISGGLYVRAPNNRIGGDHFEARNIISGNDNGGLILDRATATNNLIQGNWLGLSADGNQIVANLVAGVIINEASANVIGGATLEARNVISGNDGDGIIISGTGARSNRVMGNFIGTDSTGQMGGFGNIGEGVSLLDAPGNFVGSFGPAPGNVISGNGDFGILISGPAASGNRVSGNYVGLTSDGALPLGNGWGGILVEEGSENVVGGSTESERNVVSANGRTGIYLCGAGATNNRVCGNWVGPDASGIQAFANGFSGILVAAPRALIGGRAPGERNVSSGNALAGLQLSGPEASGAVVVGNYFGTDPTGEHAMPNGLQGIFADSVPSCAIGGADVGEGNVVSGNNGSGVTFSASADGLVLGNRIGVSANGTMPLGNGGHGVVIRGSIRTRVGLRLPQARNEIAFNRRNGISVETGAPNPLPSAQNTIVGNSIHDNAGLAIDLGNDGVTPNDPLDADDGPNGLQNRPTLDRADAAAGQLIVTGRLPSAPDRDYWIDVYAAPACGGALPGQGMTFLGARLIGTDAQGMGEFRLAFTATISVGQAISATATDAEGNTSEFSDCVSAQEGLVLSIRLVLSATQPRQLELSWKDSQGDAVLEQSLQSTGPGPWTEVSAPVMIAGDERSVRLPAEGPMRFLRLRR